MKKIILLVFAISLLLSCNQNESISKAEESVPEVKFIKGKYVRVSNEGIEFISFITFQQKNCEFEYIAMPISGSYEIDGGKIFIDAGGQIGKLSMTIIGKNRLQGSGYLRGIFINEQSQEYIDYKERTKDLFFAVKTTTLRMLPSIIDGKINDTLFKGDDVKIDSDITGNNKNWVFVENQKNGKLGWCKKTDLEKY